MKYIISAISDTHAKHNSIATTKSFRKPHQNVELPGGHILIHGGDLMTDGYSTTECENFLTWFDSIDNYDTKIFIAGNHDRIIQNEPNWFNGVLAKYKTINYLQDNDLVLYNDGFNGDYSEDNVQIYGSPWQPEFYNWAFNLPRNGDELKNKWTNIPNNTDILITHGPPFGYLDVPGGSGNNRVGCELLRERVDEIKPKICIFGHVHGSYGYYYNGHTHFINASVLNERYYYANLPLTFEWDSITNEIKWL